MFRNTRILSRFSRSFSTEKNDIKDFPWLLCKDKPRISKYPYITDGGIPFMNMLSVNMQKNISKWVGSRILQMNTGVDYFPEEFMVGASLATRQAFSLLSKQLQTKEIQPEVQNIFGPALLHRFMSAVPENTKIDISLPQIYDVNIDDIWVTMGPFTAFTGQVGYEVLQWMTLQVGSTVAPKGETFQEQQQRVKECIREGLQISVDLKIDADVIYSAVNDDDVLMYDEGRREVRVRFATPQFSPARNIVSRRDPDTGNPENDWNWTIVDIDQLVEKESIDE